MDKLITVYQERLNLHHATFSRIAHEDAMVAIVYNVTQPDGTEFILKICPRIHDYECEVYFLQTLAKTIPVPQIIQIVEPEADVHGALLMEKLTGSLLKIENLTDALTYEIGSVLARIHFNRTAGYGDLTQPNNVSADPNIHFTQKFEEGITECNNHLPQELIEQCRTYYYKNLNLLALADGPCITHRDFRPGNVIVHNDKLQGIIDWSSGRASFAQEDFCRVMEPGKWFIKPTTQESFLAGYASIRPIPDYKPMMQLLRLTKAIAIIGFIVKRGTWEGRDADLYKINRQFLESFFRDFKLNNQKNNNADK